MLTQSRRYTLAGLLIGCLFTSMALAEEEGESADTEGVDGGPEALMLYQPAKVDGYQALSVAGQNIDAAYIEETLGERHGTIVLFHDRGDNFESQGVVTPLRQHLPEYGWSTLTVSYDLPVESSVMLSATLEKTASADAEAVDTEAAAPDEASDDEAEASAEEDKAPVLPPVPNPERLAAALAFIQAKGTERLIFVGHGDGARLAVELLESSSMRVDGMVFVSLSEQAALKERLLAIRVPILDVYGGQDLPVVIKGVKQRKAMMKRNVDSDYAVRKVLGANHVYYGMEPRLVDTLRSWLYATFIKQDAS